MRARERQQQKGNEKEKSPDILIHGLIDERIADIRQTDSSENLSFADGKVQTGTCTDTACTGTDGTGTDGTGTDLKHGTLFTRRATHSKAKGE